MGQICAGKAAEPSKQGAFTDNTNYSDSSTNDNANMMQVVDATTTTNIKEALMMKDSRDANSEREQALREEQARLERIVSVAGRDMVAVRSTRGGSYYNDQGFAAALAQHLEQTMTSVTVDKCLPHSQGQAIYAILSRPFETYLNMDTEAESFLSSTVPLKEQLFAGCKPIFENLL